MVTTYTCFSLVLSLSSHGIATLCSECLLPVFYVDRTHSPKVSLAGLYLEG